MLLQKKDHGLYSKTAEIKQPSSPYGEVNAITVFRQNRESAAQQRHPSKFTSHLNIQPHLHHSTHKRNQKNLPVWETVSILPASLDSRLSSPDTSSAEQCAGFKATAGETVREAERGGGGRRSLQHVGEEGDAHPNAGLQRPLLDKPR